MHLTGSLAGCRDQPSSCCSFLQEEASTRPEEEGTAESSAVGTAGKGNDDIDSDAEGSRVTRQHVVPAEVFISTETAKFYDLS